MIGRQVDLLVPLTSVSSRVGAVAFRYSRRLLSISTAAVESALDTDDGGPSSATREIPSSVRHNPDWSAAAKKDKKDPPAVALRPNGTSRRVFLLKPTLTPRQIQGLAHRVDVLSRNDAINSIVVANDDPDDDDDGEGDFYGDEGGDSVDQFNPTCLPSYVAREEVYGRGGRVPITRMTSVSRSMLKSEHPASFLPPPVVSGGYDPSSVLAGGLHLDPQALDRELLSPLSDLARACRGTRGKVPVISFPHGKVLDSGYALSGSASYVLATHATSFQILNPRRGLAFDPIGLSYLLPRLGWEFDQPAARHSIGCALLLAICGYEADGNDMVHTGLATHYVEDGFKLGILERQLAEIDSYAMQKIYDEPRRLYGSEEGSDGGAAGGDSDINSEFRNLPVANLVQNLSLFDAAGKHEYGASLSESVLGPDGRLLDADPSLTLEEDRLRFYGENTSWLVNWAATLRTAWEEPTVEGVSERLREIGSEEAKFEGKEGDEEDLMVARTANAFAADMRRGSPLSVKVTHRLLLLGSQGGETMESCMEREKRSQSNLFTRKGGDYVRWAEHQLGGGNSETTDYARWTHGSIEEVTEDEVLEIIGE